MFRSRLIEPEVLDRAEPTVARENLADLVRINRNFGGHSTIRKLLRQVVKPDDRFTVLDVGAASGDTARVIREAYPNAHVTSLDYSPVNIEKAPAPKVIADAFQLPFAPESFDLVLSSLFLHHFENEAVGELLQGFHRVARRAVLVADLERHILPYLFLRVTKPVFGWGEITVGDGLKSVRAAFRAQELREVAKRAGLGNAQVDAHRPAFRLTMVARKALA